MILASDLGLTVSNPKAFRGDIGRDEMTAVYLKLDSDLQAGRLFKAAVAWADTFSRAKQLSGTYTVPDGCRTLDILHVALVSSLGCQHFITNDEPLKKVARRIGMMVAW